MKIRATTRSLLAAALVAAAALVPATASAGACTFQILPNPGWLGATATMEGFNMKPNSGYYANFNGDNKAPDGAMTNGNGYFKVTFTIPMDAPNPSNWFVDSLDIDGCGMDSSRNYTVLATQPTTTTAATTTTTTTTTTLAPTTTTVASTTTAAVTTTAGDTTTTAATPTTVSDTTTTTIAAEDDGGGIPIYIWIAIAALVALVLFFVGRMSSRRR